MEKCNIYTDVNDCHIVFKLFCKHGKCVILSVLHYLKGNIKNVIGQDLKNFSPPWLWVGDILTLEFSKEVSLLSPKIECPKGACEMKLLLDLNPLKSFRDKNRVAYKDGSLTA